MKQNPTTKEKFMTGVKKILDRIKPARDKIEKILADNPTFQKAAKRSAPWLKKMAVGVAAKLDKVKVVGDAATKEIRNLKEQYKTEPKKAFANTVTKARSLVEDSWKKRRHDRPTAGTKPPPGHKTKTEKQESTIG